jgi:hypothetical protein
VYPAPPISRQMGSWLEALLGQASVSVVLQVLLTPDFLAAFIMANSPKSNPFFIGFILFIFIIIFSIVLFSSNKNPEILPSLVGCYGGPSGSAYPNIKIDAKSFMSSGKIKVPISIYEDKQSLSILPSRKVLIGNTVDSAIMVVEGNVLLIRLGHDNNSFWVPDENGPSVRFVKKPC